MICRILTILTGEDVFYLRDQVETVYKTETVKGKKSKLGSIGTAIGLSEKNTTIKVANGTKVKNNEKIQMNKKNTVMD